MKNYTFAPGFPQDYNRFKKAGKNFIVTLDRISNMFMVMEGTKDVLDKAFMSGHKFVCDNTVTFEKLTKQGFIDLLEK